MGRLAASLRLAGRPGLDAGSRGAAGPAGRGRAAGRLLGLRGRRFFGRERGFAGSEGTMRRLLPAGQEVGAGGAGVPGRLRGVCVWGGGFGRASEEKKGGFSSAGRWRSSEFPARALWQSSAAQPRQREVFIGPLGRSWGDLTNFSCFEKGGEGVGSSEAIGALRPGAGRTSGFSEVVLAGVRLQSWRNCLGPVPLSSRRFGTNLKSFPACRLTTTCSAKLPARFLAMKAFFLPVAVFFFFFLPLTWHDALSWYRRLEIFSPNMPQIWPGQRFKPVQAPLSLGAFRSGLTRALCTQQDNTHSVSRSTQSPNPSLK